MSDLQETIRRKQVRETELIDQLKQCYSARDTLQDEVTSSQQHAHLLQQRVIAQTHSRDEMAAKLEKVAEKERALREQAQKKTGKVRQVTADLEQLKEATSGLDAHLKKQVHRQSDIEDELRELAGQVEHESEKRKSKDVLGRLKDLAERENTLQAELKEVRYLKVEIPRQVRENSERETELKAKLVRVKAKEADFVDKLTLQTYKRQQLETEVAAACETETQLKRELELETETGNRVKAELGELRAGIEEKELELRNLKDELVELMTQLDKAKEDETLQAKLAMTQKEHEQVECLEVERGLISARDETLESIVDERSSCLQETAAV